MYAQPLPLPAPYAEECGYTMKYTAGPSVGTTGWLGVWFYFAAMQVGFRQVDGSSSGGGHFGVLWGTEPDPGHWNLNFGFYDDVVGGGVTVRGTKPYANPGPPFYSAGGEDTYWWYGQGGSAIGNPGLAYGDTLQVRVFKSPKQDWLAADLSVGYPNPEYNGVNQKTSGSLGAETAIRMMYRIKRVGASGYTPWAWFRDVLFKNLAPSMFMKDPMFWTEQNVNHDGNSPSFSPGDWPYGPTWQFRDVVWDGRRTAPYLTCFYGADDINPATKKSDVRLITDDGVQWVQFISNNTGLTRQTAHNAVVTPTLGTFWDPAPANVTPNPSLDNSARVATPHPWY